jgi:hypothetical protein
LLGLRLRAGREKVLLEHHAELFPDALQLLEVLVVLALVLDLCVDACGAVLVLALVVRLAGASNGPASMANVPSNILTAVGKSLTRLAALRAAMTTLGEGTRS